MDKNEEQNEEISPLAQEINDAKKEFAKRYGWVKVAKDVADYTLTSFFNILSTPAIQILAIAEMMIEESTINQYQSNIKDSH